MNYVAMAMMSAFDLAGLLDDLDLFSSCIRIGKHSTHNTIKQCLEADASIRVLMQVRQSSTMTCIEFSMTEVKVLHPAVKERSHMNQLLCRCENSAVKITT